MSELVTIITRTNNRPKGFKRVRESIKGQTYPNIKHLVIYDDKRSFKYLKKHRGDDCQTVYIDPERALNEPITDNPNTGKYFPYNLYFNYAFEMVEDGYIFLLDDDDQLNNPDTIELMVKAASPDKLLIGRNGNRGIPSHSWGTKPTFCDVGGGLIFFHKQLTKGCKWDCWKCADFRYIKQLEKNATGVVWHDKSIVNSNIIGGNGLRIDI